MRQRVELHAELVLGGGDLVVVLLDLDAHRRHGREHLAAHVLRRILRRHREIAALGADAVAEVAALVVGVAVGRQLDGVELEAGVVGIGHEAHVVEDEELGLRAEDRSCRRCPSTSDRPRPSWRCRADRGCRARRSPARGCRSTIDHRRRPRRTGPCRPSPGPASASCRIR